MWSREYRAGLCVKEFASPGLVAARNISQGYLGDSQGGVFLGVETYHPSLTDDSVQGKMIHQIL